jgi:hypothetical protein
MEPVLVSCQPNHFDGGKLLGRVGSRIAERRQLGVLTLEETHGFEAALSRDVELQQLVEKLALCPKQHRRPL